MVVRIVSLLLGCTVAVAALESISVFYTDGRYTSQQGRVKGALAYGAFDPLAANSTGWGRLHIEATSGDHTAYWAAGIAEGLLTCEFVAAVAANNDDPLQNMEVVNFTQAAESWTRQNAAHNTSDYWRVVSQILAQFDGLVEGYSRSSCSASTPLTRTQLWLMQMDGDLEDVKNKFPNAHPSGGGAVTTHRPQHCSSLVKLAPDRNDL